MSKTSHLVVVIAFPQHFLQLPFEEVDQFLGFLYFHVKPRAHAIIVGLASHVTCTIEEDLFAVDLALDLLDHLHGILFSVHDGRRVTR